MANKDAPFGFRPINMDGSPYNGATLQAYIETTATAACFVGDPIKLSGTGTNTGGIMDVVYAVRADVPDPAFQEVWPSVSCPTGDTLSFLPAP